MHNEVEIMRKELTFMEAVCKMEQGHVVQFQQEDYKIFSGSPPQSITKRKGKTNEFILTGINSYMVQMPWYLDEPDETLSDKVILPTNNQTWSYSEQNVKEAIKKYIKYFETIDVPPYNLSRAKEVAEEIFGERLV